MIKIKISYETDKELKKMITILKDQIDSIKVSPNREGKFKRVEITIK